MNTVGVNFYEIHLSIIYNIGCYICRRIVALFYTYSRTCEHIRTYNNAILLCTKAVKLEHVERTSDFLIEIMPLMFIPGGVGLVTAWGDLKDMILPVVVITIISTIVVMAVTGKATELIMKTGKKKEGKKDE